MADLIISQPMTFTVDVKTGLVERPQRESLMRGDKYANRIIAELVDGSEPFDITGVTVKGEFCKPPNGDSINLPGEAKNNVAEVQLTDQCYTAGGHYEARVILVLDEVERTVLFISGDVLKSGSGNEAGEEPGGEPGGGSTGSGLPAGGTAGQVLVKVSSAQGDAIWKKLTAEEVGARPNTWTPTAEDVGALPSGGTAKDSAKLGGVDADKYALKTDIPSGDPGSGGGAQYINELLPDPNEESVDEENVVLPVNADNSAKLGGKAPEYYLQPPNLLDNSDFRNPVNQRGFNTCTTAWTVTIDRWWSGSVNTALTDDGVKVIEGGWFYQNLDYKLYQKYLANGWTAAVWLADGTLTIRNSAGLYEKTNGCFFEFVTENAASGYFTFRISASWEHTPVVKCCALYPGVYTAETLPPYVPKGYAVEMAECRRYFRRKNNALVPGFVSNSSKGITISIENDAPFVGTPTLTVTGVTWIRGAGKNITTIPTWTTSVYSNNAISPVFNIDFAEAIDQTAYASVYVYCSYTLSADL